jgi:aminopeptidase N
MIEEEKKRPTFDITQPTWCRALFLPMATNNKMVWTEQGIDWITNTITELAPINTTTASRLLNTYQHAGKLRAGLKEKVGSALERIVGSISSKANPTIHGQAKAYLSAVR